MITQIPNCMNGSHTLKILPGWSSIGNSISTSGCQPLIAPCTREYKRSTTAYKNKSSHATLKDKTFKVRGYQCFRTDRVGDEEKGDIITLIKSNINTYMFNNSTDGPEQHTVTVKTPEREILLFNLKIHNIHVRYFNNHSQSWGYGQTLHYVQKIYTT